MASQVDQRGNSRSIHGVMDGVHGVAMKKSMKFANSFNSNSPDVGGGEDDGKGTARSNIGTGRGTTHHHHIGRSHRIHPLARQFARRRLRTGRFRNREILRRSRTGTCIVGNHRCRSVSCLGNRTEARTEGSAMNRDHLRGGLIALFPILVCIATDSLVSATRQVPANCGIVISLLILTVAIRMGVPKQVAPALSPTKRRELRRQRRSR